MERCLDRNSNSDTSSGHGTHVGGTIAGNGDASAGRRAGLQGRTNGRIRNGRWRLHFAAEQGLEWTFEHSIPSQNPYHIRVVSIHGAQTVITIQTALSPQSPTDSPSKTVLPLSLPLPIQVVPVVEANVVEICEQTCTQHTFRNFRCRSNT